MTFSVGDKASYPVRGIVEIVGIEERVIAGSTLSFYVLRALDTDDKVLVPTVNAHERGLRALVDVDQAPALYSLLDDPGTLDIKEPPNRRHRQLKERLDTGSVAEAAGVYRDLQRLREKKILSFGEVRMLDTARARLATELSLVEHRPVDEVSRVLESHFPEAPAAA